MAEAKNDKKEAAKDEVKLTEKAGGFEVGYRTAAEQEAFDKAAKEAAAAAKKES